MFDVSRRLRSAVRRLERLERREARDLHRWLENTRNLLLVSVLVALPVLMGVLTYLSNEFDLLPFLLFPPLASGAYTLFAQPGSPYAAPRRFVGGLTAGALCGWLALELTALYWYDVPPETFTVNPGAAAFGLLLTGLVTWVFGLEEPQAFSTALLVLVTGASQPIYVASVAVSSVLVAGAFVLWRRNVYDRRADLLYGTLQTDDHILVPILGDPESAETVATFAAKLAAAHDAGKVVLLDVVDVPGPSGELEDDGELGDELAAIAREAEATLEHLAARLESRFDVPCETVVATATEIDATAVLQLAAETDCDLIAVPWTTEGDGDTVTPFLRTLFKSGTDVVALRPQRGRDDWRRVLVPVRRDGEIAHAMVDFAERLAGEEGSVTVCHCIDHERDRRRAEAMLANLAEAFDHTFETRVAATSVKAFLAENSAHYDLTLVGASSDRSTASRVLAPPTFGQLHHLDGDVAVVHRGWSGGVRGAS